MTLSILSIIFVLAMAYWWSTQGAFSAFIHMVCTILAGAIAIGSFEWVGNLINPVWGPGIAMLSIFAVCLVGLRQLCDRLIPGNAVTHTAYNWTLGAFCGAFAGIISCGMLVLGLHWTPSITALGYSPYVPEDAGLAKSEAAYFFPTDQITVSFYGLLSEGSMSPLITRKTLNREYPNMIKYAVTKNMHANAAKDQGSRSRKDMPKNAFQLENGYIFERDEANATLFDDFDVAAHFDKVVVYEINFSVSMAADEDGILRISPQQFFVRAREGDSNNFRLFSPVGYIQARTVDYFSKRYLWLDGNESKVLVAFAMPRVFNPTEISIKHRRKSIPQPGSPRLNYYSEGTAVAALYDTTTRKELAKGIPINQNQDFISVSDRLPFSISRTMMTQRNFPFDSTTERIIAIEPFGLIKRGEQKDLGYLSTRLMAPKPHNENRLVQVKVPMNISQSILGRATQRANIIGSIPVLIDQGGNKIFPTGWIKANEANNQMIIFYDSQRLAPFTTLAQMKFSPPAPDQYVIFIFPVKTGTNIRQVRFDRVFDNLPTDVLLNVQ